MACSTARIQVVLPCFTFILAALILTSWSPAAWPRAYVTAVLMWSLITAYTEIMNLVCARRLQVRDGLDALSVQTFVALTQSPACSASVVPRVQWRRSVLWSVVLAALLLCVWQHDPHINVNPCVATGSVMVLGRRDIAALMPVLGCVPVAWSMPNAWSAPSCARGVVAPVWLACCVATPVWLQCTVFAIAGNHCHPALLVMGIVARQSPRFLSILSLCIGAL